jgi:hypothetical protein
MLWNVVCDNPRTISRDNPSVGSKLIMGDRYRILHFNRLVVTSVEI